MESYQEAEKFLFERLPMFQRVGSAAYKNDLSNTQALLKAIGNPEKQCNFIHVAGTNGKGSTSSMLSAILIAAGYKVGLYTSPHLKHYSERIRINGAPISEAHVLSYVQAYQPLIDSLSPSFFELTTAMAFQYFADSKVDVAIIEVGLGGRLDSTNVITPLLSIITQIDYDHQQFLGDTLEAITMEKAGIIKAGVPVITSVSEESLSKLIKNRAADVKATFHHSDTYYQITHQGLIDSNYQYLIEDIKAQSKHMLLSDMGGLYQAYNLKTVLTATKLLRQLNWKISDKAIEEGLLQVQFLSGLKGRWQQITNSTSSQARLIADTGHNLSAIKYIVDMLSKESFDKLHIIWGVVNDKSVDHLMEILPKQATYYFTQASVPRALEAHKLAAIGRELHLKGEIYLTVADAFHAAIANSQKNDLIFVGGSTFVVAEIPTL